MEFNDTVFTRTVRTWYMDWEKTKSKYVDNNGNFGLAGNEYYVYKNKITGNKRILIATPTSILTMREDTKKIFFFKMKMYGIDVSEVIENCDVIIAKET